ncbi:hypothetical protein V6N12_006129 [Hibiscus sabdariffa]|uniref:Uncharacterized protein n=1 Tax=Hibiscus sabdariffa TaxID=183260 RepID=A0ABR2EY39_9ROSI
MTVRMNHVLYHVIRCEVSFSTGKNKINNPIIVTKVGNVAYNGERALNGWRGEHSMHKASVGTLFSVGSSSAVAQTNTCLLFGTVPPLMGCANLRPAVDDRHRFGLGQSSINSNAQQEPIPKSQASIR